MAENSHLEIWEAYGASWSEPNETIRKETLQKQLISTCNYTDPNVDILGIDNLSDYMGEFQNGFPGAKFVVTDFKIHHNQSLAHWNMVDGNGNILSKGASFGIYKDGQLTKMTGFFLGRIKPMNIEIFRDYCLSKNAVTESFPFSKLPEALVFKVADKMFTVTYISAFDSIALKCDSELIDELKAQYSAVGKPPYFDEKHWISVSMDGSVPDKKIMEWIDNSYNLVVAKLPKSAKAKFNL